MKFFDQLEKYAAYALLALMAVIVLSATLEVAYEIATNMFKPPGFFIGVRDLFELFGLPPPSPKSSPSWVRSSLTWNRRRL